MSANEHDDDQPDRVSEAELMACEKERDALRARVAKLEGELQRIVRWSEAYPLAIFPEPDLKQARELLEAGGMTLDALSASAMRHVVNGVGKIAKAALEDAP